MSTQASLLLNKGGPVLTSIYSKSMSVKTTQLGKCIFESLWRVLSGLENRNGRGDSLRWPRDTLYPLKLALTSPTSGGRSVGIVRWRTKIPEFDEHSTVWVARLRRIPNRDSFRLFPKSTNVLFDRRRQSNCGSVLQKDARMSNLVYWRPKCGLNTYCSLYENGWLWYKSVRSITSVKSARGPTL
jgi:hypothetical protein